jgi:hypothetical protein
MAEMAFAGWRTQWVVAVHSDQAPSDAEWDAYVSFCNASFTGSNQKAFLGVVIFTDGGGPGPAQIRRMGLINSAQETFTTAVISDAGLVLKAVLAMVGLFNPRLKSFSTALARKGLEHARIPASDHDAVFALARALATKVRKADAVKRASA